MEHFFHIGPPFVASPGFNREFPDAELAKYDSFDKYPEDFFSMNLSYPDLGVTKILKR